MIAWSSWAHLVARPVDRRRRTVRLPVRPRAGPARTGSTPCRCTTSTRGSRTRWPYLMLVGVYFVVGKLWDPMGRVEARRSALAPGQLSDGRSAAIRARTRRACADRRPLRRTAIISSWRPARNRLGRQDSAVVMAASTGRRARRRGDRRWRTRPPSPGTRRSRPRGRATARRRTPRVGQDPPRRAVDPPAHAVTGGAAVDLAGAIGVRLVERRPATTPGCRRTSRRAGASAATSRSRRS